MILANESEQNSTLFVSNPSMTLHPDTRHFVIGIECLHPALLINDFLSIDPIHDAIATGALVVITISHVSIHHADPNVTRG